jgi:predicted DNA-binding WGR domain protein
MAKTRYFIHPKAGGRFWSIEVDGNLVTVQHGKVGGKLTSAGESYTGKNLGKSNEISPEQDAANRALVTIEKKQREGYVEYAKRRRSGVQMGDYGIPGLHPEAPGDPKSSGYFYKIGEEIKAEIDFDNLPESFCFYKPDNTVSGVAGKADAGGQGLVHP